MKRQKNFVSSSKNSDGKEKEKKEKKCNSKAFSVNHDIGRPTLVGQRPMKSLSSIFASVSHKVF